MKALKRNIPIAGVALLAVVGLSVAAVAQSGGSSPGDSVAQVTSIEPAAKQAMDVLDEPRAAADAMPTEVAQAIDEHAKFGMNPGLSRKSIATVSGSVYVIPADGYVCYSLTVGDGASIGCAETDDVAAGKVGATTVTLPAGGIAIYGIVPDGVDSVTVHTGKSDETVAKVTDNAYFTAVPEGTPLRNVSYTGPSGLLDFPIYDPAVAFDE